ncbi:hypothetical protein J6590_083868 [Homalodisca vitripennis]|nr:hypothetical protein J6590_083868 [Homalodisca vitripennis]
MSAEQLLYRAIHPSPAIVRSVDSEPNLQRAYCTSNHRLPGFRQLILTPDFLLSPILTLTSCLSHTSDFLFQSRSRRLLNQTLAVWTPAHCPGPIRIRAPIHPFEYRRVLRLTLPVPDTSLMLLADRLAHIYHLYVCIDLSLHDFTHIYNGSLKLSYAVNL